MTMTQRYYLTADAVEKLKECLDAVRHSNPDQEAINLLIEDIEGIIFGTPIPDDQADEIERRLADTDPGLDW
jgi:hypothetical protein